jgi:hypothetical protein
VNVQERARLAEEELQRGRTKLKYITSYFCLQFVSLFAAAIHVDEHWTCETGAIVHLAFSLFFSLHLVVNFCFCLIWKSL